MSAGSFYSGASSGRFFDGGLNGFALIDACVGQSLAQLLLHIVASIAVSVAGSCASGADSGSDSATPSGAFKQRTPRVTPSWTGQGGG